MAKPTFIQEADPRSLALRLLRDLADHLEPEQWICIPTGKSPEAFYEALVQDSSSAKLWRQLHFLQLDEYLAPPAGSKSFKATLRDQVFDPLGIESNRVHSIDATGKASTEIHRLSQLIDQYGPPRTAILGLGSNGHIAFNEPCDDPPSGYHTVDLSPETLNDNFADPAPESLQAITIGLDLLRAIERIYLLVPQRKKAAILDRCLRAPYDPRIPGSCLHDHPDLHIYRC